jgi:hypothetical protein
MRTLRLIGTLCCVIIATMYYAWAQTESDRQTTLSVYRHLARSMGIDVATAIPHDDTSSVGVSIEPRQHGWLVEAGLLDGLTTQGCRIKEFAAASLDVECSLEETNVRYDNIRQASLFSPREVDRHVVLRMHVKVAHRNGGDILLRKDFEQTFVDTVYVADVPSLETPGVPQTRGELPPEGFFASLVEPVIVVATIGLAIFLLFSVRS